MAATPSDGKTTFQREKGYFESFLWAVVFFLIIVNVTLKIVSDYWAATDEYNVQRDLQTIQDFSEAKEGTDFNIMLLGTSRLRHALNYGFYPKIPVKLSDGRTVTMLTIGVDAGSFSSFDYMIDDILAADPDYLVIERPLLTNDSRGGGGRTTSALWVLMAIDGYIDRAIVRGLSREEEWEMARQGHFVDCLDDFSKFLLDETLSHNEERDFHNLDGEEPEAARDFIARALAHGIKVLVVSFGPYTKILEQYGYASHMLDFGNLDHNPARDDLLPAQYQDVSWWSYKPSGDLGSQFCDFTHYNEKGRNLSTQWFMNKVLELGDKL